MASDGMVRRDLVLIATVAYIVHNLPIFVFITRQAEVAATEFQRT